MSGPTIAPEEALLPCPSGHTRATRDNNNIYGSWWVKCAKCSWRTAGDTEAEAIAAWNTRATPPSSPETSAAGEVERLRAELRETMQLQRGRAIAPKGTVERHWKAVEQAIAILAHPPSPEREVERKRCAMIADAMALAAAARLEGGHDDDAAAQLDTATEIARAIREPGYGCEVTALAGDRA